MRKIIVLIIVLMSMITFSACENQEKSVINDEQFRHLAGNDYNAIGGVITAYDLEFEFAEPANYDTYVPLEPKNSKSFNGSASVIAVNIPAKLIDNLPQDIITGCEPEWVDAILAQAFEKVDLEKKFIIINGGRYFSQQLEKYLIYEDDEIIVYNLLPLIINEQYEMYLNSQKPISTLSDAIQTYHHWIEYVDELKEVTNHVKVVKKQ